MSDQRKAVEKMANRVLRGYAAVHEKNYDKAKQLLQPLKDFMHAEDRPNVAFLAYLTIAQIGSKDIDNFLLTYEELQKFPPKNEKEEQLKKRVDDLFFELMEVLNLDLEE